MVLWEVWILFCYEFCVYILSNVIIFFTKSLYFNSKYDCKLIMYNFVYKLHSNELYMQIIIYFLKNFFCIFIIYITTNKSQNLKTDQEIIIYVYMRIIIMIISTTFSLSLLLKKYPRLNSPASQLMDNLVVL